MDVRIRMKKYQIILASLILTSIMVSACVPIPTRNINTPSISGSLHSKESALNNYQVYASFSVSNPCHTNGTTLQTRTDPLGNFDIPATHEWSLIRWAVPVDMVSFLNLCFIAPDGDKRWAYIKHIRTPAWAADMQLTCIYENLLSSPIEIDQRELSRLNSTCSQ